MDCVFRQSSDKLSMVDLLIESSTTIKRKLKKMNLREISDLVSELDMETAKMIRYHKNQDGLFPLVSLFQDELCAEL